MMDAITFMREGDPSFGGWVAIINGVRRFKIGFIPARPSGWDPVVFRRSYGDDFDADHKLLDRVRDALFSRHLSELRLENMDDIVVEV